MKTMYFLTALCTACLFSNKALAVQQVEMLTRDGQQNEIPILDNRFRIDSNLDSITLLFFRKTGSPAVVLVRPDGSKHLVSDSIKDLNVDWYDEDSYDIIKIKNPMPGPWQALGKILPQSRIVVMGDIGIKIEPFPPLLFRGEIIKVTGQVLNDNEPTGAGFFNDAVNLDLNFISTNNDKLANFGAGRQKVTSFEDNGYNFDEHARDGIFTGELKLTFLAGEWIPEFQVKTPLFERLIVKNPILIHEPPLSYDITFANEEIDTHLVTINIDDKIVKPETLIMQGKIYYPNNEEQMFTIDAESSLSRQLKIKNYEWGRYSVELSIFGTNINGREFMATPPIYKFEIERPIEVVPDIIPAMLIEPEPLIEVKPEDEKMATSTIISLIVGCNTLILLLGWLAIRIFVQKKSIKFKVKLPFLKKKKTSEGDVADIEKNQVDKNGSKSDRSGEILNLSMSDD